MGYSKADFKATRELLGLTQQDVAEMACVNVATIKKWERPGFPEPPADVWDLIDGLDDMQEETVDAAVDHILSAGGEDVQMTYYRSQDQYDEMGRDPGPYRMANANARLVAHRLRALGVEVDFCYPDDPDNIYHNA